MDRGTKAAQDHTHTCTDSHMQTQEEKKKTELKLGWENELVQIFGL